MVADPPPANYCTDTVTHPLCYIGDTIIRLFFVLYTHLGRGGLTQLRTYDDFFRAASGQTRKML